MNPSLLETLHVGLGIFAGLMLLGILITIVTDNKP